MSSVNVCSRQHNIVWNFGGHFVYELHAIDRRRQEMKQWVGDPKRIPVLGQSMSWFYALASFTVGTIYEHTDWKIVLLVATSVNIVSFLQLANEILKSTGT